MWVYFSLFNCVKVVIGTVGVGAYYWVKKNEAVVDPSLIACVNLLRSEIRPIFVFDGKCLVGLFKKIIRH